MHMTPNMGSHDVTTPCTTSFTAPMFLIGFVMNCTNVPTDPGREVNGCFFHLCESALARPQIGIKTPEYWRYLRSKSRLLFVQTTVWTLTGSKVHPDAVISGLPQPAVSEPILLILVCPIPQFCSSACISTPLCFSATLKSTSKTDKQTDRHTHAHTHTITKRLRSLKQTNYIFFLNERLLVKKQHLISVKHLY